MREAKYRGYTIEAVSYRGQPEGQPGGWLAKALIVWDQHGETHHQQIADADIRLFETQEDADVHALQLARAWIDGRVAP